MRVVRGEGKTIAGKSRWKQLGITCKITSELLPSKYLDPINATRTTNDLQPALTKRILGYLAISAPMLSRSICLGSQISFMAPSSGCLHRFHQEQDSEKR